MEQFSDGQQLFDRDGAMAAAGRCDDGMIQRWLREPYFQLSPPKSTGRECFGQEDLRRRLQELESVERADAVATLTGFTAAVVAQDLDRLRADRSIHLLELLVAGGGCRNPVLMSELQRRCRGLAVRASDQIGLAAEAREALVFALLAWWHHRGHPGNAPAITGATREACLGVRVAPA
jgi:anhydro-N-acetylmuramic acid kinase